MKDSGMRHPLTSEVYTVVFKRSIAVIKGILKQGKKCFRDFRRKPGKRLNVRCEDRVYMEETILPSLAQLPDGSTVLFVGVEWYTSHYERYFQGSGVVFITCDIEPSHVCYGSSIGHIIADIQNMTHVTGRNVYDVAIIAGVFGYGINNEEQFNRTVASTHSLLKDNGILIVGWQWNRSLEPDSRNLDIMQQYFKPVDGFQGMPFHKTLIRAKYEYHIFQKRKL